METLNSEQMEQQVSKLNQLYITYRKRYVLSLPGGRMLVPKRKGGAYCQLTDRVLWNHLQGKYAVAVFAGAQSSRFVCFDVDDGQPQTVMKLLDAMELLGFPRDCMHVSFSGSKGYHVELFFDQLVKTNKLKALYCKVLVLAGLDAHAVEFRPLYSNAIKLPLSVHAKTGKMCWFVDRDTLEPIMDYGYLMGIRQIPAALLNDLVEDAQMYEGTSKQIVSNRSSSEFGETPEEDDVELQKVGTRHNAMRKIAVYMRQTGQSREMIEQALREWYARQDAELIRSAPTEVMRDIEELLDWVFSESFVVHQTTKPGIAKLTSTDVRLVLSSGSRSKRRVLFLLLVLSITGRADVKMAKIGEVVGLSRKTVQSAVQDLEEAGKLQRRSGITRYLGYGKYARDSNQYLVPHYCGDKSQVNVEILPEKIMEDFEHVYHATLQELIPHDELEALLPAEELKEHDLIINGGKQEDMRIDVVGQERVFQHETYGELTAYVVESRLFYPLAELGRCMGWKHPDQMSTHCSSREFWNIERHGQVVKKGYIEKENLKGLLKRSHAKNKKELLAWLCPEEEEMENGICTHGNEE